MQNEEIQIQFLTEDIKNRQTKLENLTAKNVTLKQEQHHRLQIDELKRGIDFDLYRIEILQRKLALQCLSRLSVKNPDPNQGETNKYQ